MICRPDRHFRWAAAVALTLAAAASGASAPRGVAEAVAALERGDGIAAEVAAKRALGAGAPRSDVAALIGEAELLQGDLDDARDWLAAGNFSAATHERGFHALGRLEIEDGDLDAAAAAFDRALEAGPGSSRLWVDIARLRYLAGQHHLAVEAAARAVGIDPQEPRALEFQAQLTRDAKGVVAALPWFERALAKAPEDIGLLGEYAATLGEAGRHKDMLTTARRMVEIDPRHPRAYYLQAVLAARAGRDDLALRLLARTNGTYDETPAGMLLAGILELRTGNAALAVERFDELVRRQPDNAVAPSLLGRALLANGEANEVVARYAPLADRPDASPYLLALVGRAYEQLGRRDDAATYLDRAVVARAGTAGVLQGGPEQPFSAEVISVGAVRRTLGQGRVADARSLAAELSASYPDSIDVEVLAGDVALLAGDPAAALSAYERAATVRRDFALLERMVEALRGLRREETATALLADYVRQNPRSAAAAAALGRAMAKLGQWEQAGALLAHANALAPGDPLLLAELADAERARGNAQASLAAASRAYALQRSDLRVATALLEARDANGTGSRALAAKVRRLADASRPSD